MKIGEEVYIHGYIDEIRKDTVIIRNEGGYFGTSPSEIKTLEQQPSNKDVQRVVDYLLKPTSKQPTSEDCEYNRGYRDGYDKGNLNGYELRKAEEKKSEDCISRQEAIRLAEQGQVQGFEWQIKKLMTLPSVAPTHGTCKNCKHINCEHHEETCDIDEYNPNFYCADFEKRGSKVGWSSLENVREKVERGNENGSN